MSKKKVKKTSGENPKSSSKTPLPQSNQPTDGDDYELLFGYANFIFEQVRFQQETRDKWFEHYLTIVGAVSGFATIVFAVFSENWNVSVLQITLGGIFILTGFLGILFYFLFLIQRLNYKLHYRVLNELQHTFADRFLKEPYSFYYPSKRTPFVKLKYGADFYASLIQRLLVSFCALCGTALMMLGFSKTIFQAAIAGGAAFAVVLVCLTIIHKKYEKTV